MGEDGAGGPPWRAGPPKWPRPKWGPVARGPQENPQEPPENTHTHKDKCFLGRVGKKPPTPLRLVIKIMSISQE
jgi:hypothetical protein